MIPLTSAKDKYKTWDDVTASWYRLETRGRSFFLPFLKPILFFDEYIIRGLVNLTDASSLEVATNNQEYCNAKVLEIYEDCFLAECLDVTSGLLKTGTKVLVSKNIVAAAGVPELNTGDHVRIVYNGLKRTKTLKM